MKPMMMKRNRPRVVRNNRPQSEGQSHNHNNHRDHNDDDRNDNRPRHHHNRAYLQQQHDKYLNMARDALSMSDRVLAESHYQHADHFLRLLNEQREYRAQMDAKIDAKRIEKEVASATVSSVETQPILTETLTEDKKTEGAPSRRHGKPRSASHAPTSENRSDAAQANAADAIVNELVG